MGWPLITFKPSIVPCLLMTAWRITSPVICACFAIGGYTGVTLLIRLPEITPWEILTLCGATRGGAALAALNIPPSTPPGAPPDIPPNTPDILVGAGASSSTIFLIFSGILVGVRSTLSTISGGARFTTGAAAGGGGGGGGGGGATRNVSSCLVGSASV